MPVAVGGRSPPPRNCPICRGGIWTREDTRSVYEAWQRYNVHVHTTHPEYERWNRRMSWYYVIGLVIFFAFPVAATQVSSTVVARFLIILSLALAFAVFATVFAIKQSGKRRFRELWNQEHGGPVNPA